MDFSGLCCKRHLCILSTVFGCSFVQGAPISAKPAASVASQGFDGVSCAVRLANGGPVLRVPKQFLGAETCATEAQPEVHPALGFDVNYPEMTPGAWIGVMDRYLAHDLGEGAPLDKFSARVVWLFFADEPRSGGPRNWHGPEPQVWQMRENAIETAKRENGYTVPRISLAEIAGLRRIKEGDDLKPSAAALIHLKAIGWVQPPESKGELIEMPDADYELVGNCDGQFACQGHVQLKESHIQYRFIIPVRAKEHMAEFISATNQLVTSWMKK